MTPLPDCSYHDLNDSISLASVLLSLRNPLILSMSLQMSISPDLQRPQPMDTYPNNSASLCNNIISLKP